MASGISGIAAIGFVALVSGCVSVSPQVHSTSAPPVQFNFNVNTDLQPNGVKKLQRGAVSGTPQHMGFFYSVNPDCTSGGLVHTTVKFAARHGSVAFVNTDGYSNFPRGSAAYECNKLRSPGVEVVYTSEKGFTGTDEFTVIGIGPRGQYMETHYTVEVIAP